MGIYYEKNYTERVKIGGVELPCQVNVEVSEGGNIFNVHNGIIEKTGEKPYKVEIKGILVGKDGDEDADLMSQMKLIRSIAMNEAVEIISQKTDSFGIKKISLETAPQFKELDFDDSIELTIIGIEDEETELHYDLSQKRKEQVEKITEPKKQTKKNVHIVRRGETLFLIAQKYYGNGYQWRVIYQKNKSVIGSDPNKIDPGMELVIPELSTDEKEYTVVSGDTYAKIAKKVYGDAAYKRTLMNANDRKSLIVGDTVKVPPLQDYEQQTYITKHRSRRRRRRRSRRRSRRR